MDAHWNEDDEEDDGALLAILALAYEGQERLVQSTREKSYLRRRDLLPNPREGTAWEALYRARSDQAFILTTGMDVETFDFLLLRFEEECSWTGIAVSQFDYAMHALQQVFAITPAVCSRYINFGLQILQQVLRRLPDCGVVWPRDDNQFAEYADMIKLRHPLVEQGFCFVDGLNLPVSTSLDDDIQNAYYNGWTSSHYCSCVFGFAPDGRIIYASINAPGSWHDATIARDLYKKLATKTPRGYYAIATPRSLAARRESMGESKLRSRKTIGSQSFYVNKGVSKSSLSFDDSTHN